MTHSTHFMYGYIGVSHMVKYHSDSEQGLFYMHHPTDRITHITASVTPVVEYWIEQEIAQWVHHDRIAGGSLLSRSEMYLHCSAR